MNDTLEFPPIEAPAATLAPASIKSAVLAQFADAERTVTALADKYRRVAYDCTTTKGMADAKAARMDLRENGRYAVQRAESRVKTEVNDLKRIMADEVERIVGIVRPVEDAIDQQIKAEEARKEAERQERERQAAEAARLEAERKQRREDGIATLAGYVAKAKGATAEKMAAGIAFVEKIVIEPAHWQEYTERAAVTLHSTLQTLREMHAAQVKAEADEAELIALRAEKAAREQREREEAEAAARVESERLAEAARQESKLSDFPFPPAGDTMTLPEGGGTIIVVGPDAGKDWEQALRGSVETAPADAPLIRGEIGSIAGRVNIVSDSEMTAAWPLPKAEPDPAPVDAPAVDPQPLEPTITIGDINARLGFLVTADFVIGLGFVRQVRIVRGVNFLASDWPRLCDALVKHITAKRGAY